MSSEIPGAATRLERDAETPQALLPWRMAFAVGVDEDLRAAAERLVRDRVHVADDHVRLPALLEQRLGAAVDGDEHGPEVADVRAHDPEVALVARAARDHEGVAIAEAGAERREVDPLGQQPALLAEIPQRVVREVLQSLGDAALLLGQRSGQLVLVERAARGEARAVPEEARAADGQPLTVRDLLEELAVGDVDQAHAAADEEQRPGVRIAARLRRRDVDDDAHARLDELLGGDAVDVGVVDDRDVVRAEPAHELLRPLAEPRRAGVLDQAVHPIRSSSAEMNSLPPSIRSSSSRRCASSSSSIRVWVGSPGIFSTR